MAGALRRKGDLDIDTHIRKIKEDESHLQAMHRGLEITALRRQGTRQDPDPRLQASRTVRKHISVL